MKAKRTSRPAGTVVGYISNVRSCEKHERSERQLESHWLKVSSRVRSVGNPDGFNRSSSLCSELELAESKDLRPEASWRVTLKAMRMLRCSSLGNVVKRIKKSDRSSAAHDQTLKHSIWGLRRLINGATTSTKIAASEFWSDR
jgi:hypothetical protein